MAPEALAGMMEEVETEKLYTCDKCGVERYGLHGNSDTWDICCQCVGHADKPSEECWEVPVTSLPFVPGVL